jgi:hypothetical protein
MGLLSAKVACAARRAVGALLALTALWLLGSGLQMAGGFFHAVQSFRVRHGQQRLPGSCRIAIVMVNQKDCAVLGQVQNATDTHPFVKQSQR